MFDIGWSELLLIGIVALIVVGPKDLPVMFRTLGRFTAKARSMGREFQRAMDDAARESGARDVADDLKTMTSKKNLGLDALDQAAEKFEKWKPNLKPAAKSAAPATTTPATTTPATTAPAAAPAAPKGPATRALAEKRAAEAAERKAARTTAGAKAPTGGGAKAPTRDGAKAPAGPAPAAKPGARVTAKPDTGAESSEAAAPKKSAAKPRARKNDA